MNGAAISRLGQSQTLGDVAYSALLERIILGTYSQSQRLPPESALSVKLGISRPVLREALARLRDDGIIVSRRGSGSYVRAQPSNAILSFAPVGSIADMQRCFEFRTGLEGEAAALAATNRTDGDLDVISQAFARLEQAVTQQALGVEEDFGFHLAIASATQNRYYSQTLSSLHDSTTTGMTITRNLTLRRSQVHGRTVQGEHLRILGAIRGRDAAKARDGMRTHIENARRRVFEG